MSRSQFPDALTQSRGHATRQRRAEGQANISQGWVSGLVENSVNLAAVDLSSRILPMPQVQLRPATLDDVEALFRIHRDSLGPYVEQTWGPWDESWQVQNFREAFDVKVRQVIESEGQVIGFVDVVQKEDSTVLASIEIAPAFQRRGIGAQLIRDVLERAASRGVPVNLRVLRINPARRLYERLGFEVVDATETHYMMTAHPVRQV
jgi:ribosomal protein S18 acetylase RimI-like enzyme